jgi:hypothetical protein
MTWDRKCENGKIQASLMRLRKPHPQQQRGLGPRPKSAFLYLRQTGFDNLQPWAGTLTQRHARVLRRAEPGVETSEAHEKGKSPTEIVEALRPTIYIIR